jgi:hypothetical protein
MPMTIVLVGKQRKARKKIPFEDCDNRVLKIGQRRLWRRVVAVTI